jgi:hypothetical protein
MELITRTRQVLKRLRFMSRGREEDLAIILREARKSMERQMSKLKANAMFVLWRRNRLQDRLEAREKRIPVPVRDWIDGEIAERLEAREKRPGDPEPEQDSAGREIAELRRMLEEAEHAADAAKDSIRALEAQVRERASERLARVGWKQARINEELNRALSEISMWREERDFERARERLRRRYEHGR